MLWTEHSNNQRSDALIRFSDAPNMTRTISSNYRFLHPYKPSPLDSTGGQITIPTGYQHRQLRSCYPVCEFLDLRKTERTYTVRIYHSIQSSVNMTRAMIRPNIPTTNRMPSPDSISLERDTHPSVPTTGLHLYNTYPFWQH